jgi:hypothetical protein
MPPAFVQGSLLTNIHPCFQCSPLHPTTHLAANRNLRIGTLDRAKFKVLVPTQPSSENKEHPSMDSVWSIDLSAEPRSRWVMRVDHFHDCCAIHVASAVHLFDWPVWGLINVWEELRASLKWAHGASLSPPLSPDYWRHAALSGAPKASARGGSLSTSSRTPSRHISASLSCASNHGFAWVGLQPFGPTAQAARTSGYKLRGH